MDGARQAFGGEADGYTRAGIGRTVFQHVHVGEEPWPRLTPQAGSWNESEPT